MYFLLVSLAGGYAGGMFHYLTGYTITDWQFLVMVFPPPILGYIAGLLDD